MDIFVSKSVDVVYSIVQYTENQYIAWKPAIYSMAIYRSRIIWNNNTNKSAEFSVTRVARLTICYCSNGYDSVKKCLILGYPTYSHYYYRWFTMHTLIGETNKGNYFGKLYTENVHKLLITLTEIVNCSIRCKISVLLKTMWTRIYIRTPPVLEKLVSRHFNCLIG